MTRESSPRPRRRRWLARLIVLGGAFLLAFALAEIAARIWWRESAVLFPRYHTDASYGPYRLRRLRPNAEFWHTSADGSWRFVTNAQGFRDTREYRHEKPPGIRRVLCLGDSNTQGFEARQERIYPAVIERRLARLGHAAEVLNAGISGFGTAEQLAFLEHEGMRYAPDVVVLGFFANDPDDNVKSGLFRSTESGLAPAEMTYQPGIKILNAINRLPPVRWLSEHSYFYSLLFNRVWEAAKALRLRTRSEASAAEWTTRPPDAAGHGLVPAYQRQLTRQLLARMHAVCKERGVPLVILDVPWMPKPDGDFASSIPEGMEPVLRENADALLPAGETLGSYRGVAEIFVPHGQHHINETAHLLLGMAVAEKIGAWWKAAP